MKLAATTVLFFLLFINLSSQVNLVEDGDFSPCSSWTTEGNFFCDDEFDCWNSAQSYAFVDDLQGDGFDYETTGVIWQIVDVDDNLIHAELHFSYSISTEDPSSSDNDILYVFLSWNVNGQEVYSVLEFSNDDNTGSFGTDCNPYEDVQITIDEDILNDIENEDVKINFGFTTDDEYGTVFRIDDVSFWVTYCDEPIANFSSSTGNIQSGQTIDFFDDSSNDPTDWYWTFTGPEFIDSDEQNPNNIEFALPGNYEVCLTVENECGNDTECESNFIVVDDIPCIPPPTPINFIVQQIEIDMVEISWDLLEDATVNIYYSLAGCDDLEYYDQTNQNSLVLIGSIPGVTYYYAVSSLDECESQLSDCISITIDEGECTELIVTEMPMNDLALLGEDVAFDVCFTGSLPVSYTWIYPDGTEFSGISADSCIETLIDNVSDEDEGEYYLTLTNCAEGSVSVFATLTIEDGGFIELLYPLNGTFEINTTIDLSVNLIGSISTQEVEISYDGGDTWIWVWGMSTTSNNFLFPSISFSYPSNECRVRVSAVIDGVYYSASSDNLILVVPQEGIGFCINDDLCHLYWPFEASAWPCVDRNGWHGSQASSSYVFRPDCDGGGGSGNGEGGHLGSDYFADDWNNSTGDIGSAFLAPMDGIILNLKNGCTGNCYSNGQCSGCGTLCSTSGYGNMIIIQGLAPYENYAFRIAHLQSVNSDLDIGDQITHGTLLGYIGNTGCSSNSHAHLCMYKNLNEETSGGISGLEKLSIIEGSTYLGGSISDNIFSCNFIFDASNSIECNEGTGGMFEEENISTTIQFLCVGDSLLLIAPSGYQTYYWNNGQINNEIYINTPGVYSVTAEDFLGYLYYIEPIEIYEWQLTEVELGPDVTKCDGESVILEIQLTEMEPEFFVGNYEWSNGSNEPTIQISTSGTYWLNYTDQLNCSSSMDSINVLFVDGPEQPVISVLSENQLETSSVGISYIWYYQNVGQVIGLGTTIIAELPGIYWVEAFDEFGCGALSNSISVVTVNEFILSKDVNVYPNPNSGEFILRLKNSGNIHKVELLNCIGQTLIDIPITNLIEGDNPINSELSDGVYFIRIETYNTCITKSIVISQ